MNDRTAELEARLAQLERQVQFMGSAEAVKRGGGDVVPLTTDDDEMMPPDANRYLNRIVRGTPDRAEIALRDGDGVWQWAQFAPQPEPPSIFDLWPVGVPMAWFLDLEDIPDGFQLCDGTNGTPDMRGRFPVGAGGAYDLGDTGGADSVTLTEAQMPSHSHPWAAGENGAYIATIGPPLGAPFLESGSTVSIDLRSRTGTAGLNQAHENRPPYYAWHWIAKPVTP